MFPAVMPTKDQLKQIKSDRAKPPAKERDTETCPNE